MTLGMSIYLMFRPETLIVFKWLSVFSLNGPVYDMRLFTLPLKPYVPGWVVFSLPDGLWVFSYVCFLFYLWNCKVNKDNLFWLILIPLIAVFSELGQIGGYVPGVFDPLDIFLYLLGASLPFIIILLNNNYKPKQI